MTQASPNFPLHFGKSSLGLENMPLEVFATVCNNLEPIWLWNLSHVCKSTYYRLSFTYGNLIWYNVMPVSLWKEAERFQYDEELRVAMMPDGRAKYQALQALKKNPDGSRASFLRQRSLLQDPALPHVTRNSVPPPSQQFRTTTWDRSHDFGYDISPIRNNFAPSPSLDRGDRSLRKPVKALGSAYKPVFNYKREILGHLKAGQRCYLCLSIKTDRDTPVHRWHWGLLWCRTCLAKYTVGATAVTVVRNYEALLDSATMSFFRSSYGKAMFYLPEIDNLVRQQTGLDLKTHTLAVKQCRYTLEVNRVQRSILEARRRVIRLKIIAFAKLMWDGIDPDPDLVNKNGVLTLQDRPHLTSPAMYRSFRERFAPTSDLGKFLFPEYLIADQPRDVPYNELSGWMADPTTTLSRNTTVKDVNDRWVSNAAESMLSHLTVWFDPRYTHKGFGGYVVTWVKAAKEFQTRRLEAELESGLTVGIGWAPSLSRGLHEFARIRKLRAKCGLQEEGDIEMASVPKRLDVHDFSVPYTLEQYVRLDNRAAVVARKRQRKINDFNKIIKHTCVSCPATGGLFFPMGIQGMLDHMIIFHPMKFWYSDDFHIMG
ncbi:hypothetical protein MMC18_001871 [Xylographa bjoerkii]|nr:hypothetical protein [Xylographa bjoerkii]